MKRLLALIISALFVFCACAETVNNETSDASGADIPLQSHAGQPVRENPQRGIISTGASYTTSSIPGDQYADSYNSELTDGSTDVVANSHMNESLVGFLTGNQTIVLDLLEPNDKIYGVSVSAYNDDEEPSVSTNYTINVFYSMNNVKWDFMGIAKCTEVKMKSLNKYEFTLPKYVEARYIKFTIKGDKSWVFLEELQVIADVESKNVAGFGDRVNDLYSTLGTVTAPKDGADVDTTLNEIDVSKNATYKIDAEKNPSYPDNGKILTDGVATGIYAEEGWFGFKGGKDAKITIDLGKTVEDIALIKASMFANYPLQIKVPLAFAVAAIDENNNRTDLGIIYGREMKMSGNYQFKLPLSKTVSAKSIEITFYTEDTFTYLVEEISVCAYRDQVENNLYPPVEIETGEFEEFPNGSDVYKDIILKKTQQIFTAGAGGDAANNTPITSTVLTDGIFSGGYDIHNGRFFKFNGGERRHVIYDLEYISAMDKFTASFCNEVSWAVYAPKNFAVTVSDDGENWYSLGTAELGPTSINGIYQGQLQLPEKVKARYVVFSFEINAWCGCDELQVFGTETAEGGVDLASTDYKTIGENGSASGGRIEPSEEILDGAKDLCLLYYNSEKAGYTVEDLIPYVAYVDEEGNIKDTMFDSFLFLHSVGAMPSGGYPYGGSNLSDWKWSTEHIFAEGANLNALEDAAGQVKTALGLAEDFTYKITIAVYYPTTKIKDFGDVDGDGVSENMSVYADRIKALSWYIDDIQTRFNAAGFKNIELVGYYWFHEQIDEKEDPESPKLIKELSDLIHAKDLDFTWIPWFSAPGFNEWERFGFDVACMQPNYVFTAEAPYSNIINCDKYTKQYGMGIEMEIDEKCLGNRAFFKKYMEYVASGAELGYMNDTIVMYYQGFTIFHDAAYSGSYIGRTIYDSTYHFIKGDLKNVPDTITGLTYDAEKNTPISGQIEFTGEGFHEIELTKMPENGTISFDSDGGFTFYPEKDFTGEVTFSFRYNEYLSWSDDCVVTINVK